MPLLFSFAVCRFVCHGLITGTNYVFRVKAVNAAGYSLSSSDSDAVVVQAAICESPRLSSLHRSLCLQHSSHPPPICAPFLWEYVSVRGMTAQHLHMYYPSAITLIYMAQPSHAYGRRDLCPLARGLIFISRPSVTFQTHLSSSTTKIILLILARLPYGKCIAL